MKGGQPRAKTSALSALLAASCTPVPDDRKAIPRVPWTGPPARAREDVVEKYPGVKKGR